jgi:hypothetical protein
MEKERMELRPSANGLDERLHHQSDNSPKPERAISVDKLLLKHFREAGSHPRFLQHIFAVPHHRQFNGASKRLNEITG